MKLRTVLSHLVTGSLMLLAVVAIDQIADNSTISLVLFTAIFAVGALSGLFLIALGPRRRKPSPPTRIDRPDFAEPAPAPPPAQQPIVINMQPPPAPPPNPWPAPQPPRRPVLASDFREPSIFDPLPPDVPSYKPRHSPFAQPAFDPLAYQSPPLPELEKETGSPWDDVQVTFDGPLHSGPLLERRPPRAGEIGTIRDIYAETQSLNKTIQRVYGTKDAKTHGWVKGALEL